MKRIKKITALVVTAAMALTLFTACVPLYLLGDFYDWFFGSNGGSSASRSNGVDYSKFEDPLNEALGVTPAIPHGPNAEEAFKKVTAAFQAEWLGNDGKLNNTAKSALDPIAQDYTTADEYLSTWAFINVCQVDAQMVSTYAARSNSWADDLLAAGYKAYDTQHGTNSGSKGFASELATNEVNFKNNITWCCNPENCTGGTKEMCAGTFTKDGKYYAAFVIILKNMYR